jgi:peroxiredoxin family protein
VKKLAIIVRDDAYDRVLTPLAFAYGAAASGIESDFLFINWAVRLLSVDGQPAPVTHPGQDAWLKEQVGKAGLPPEIRDIIRALKATGKVRFHACSLAAQIFGVDAKQLIPEAEGIVGSTWFLEEKAGAEGTHTQYF